MQITDYSPQELTIIKARLNDSLIDHARFMFRFREGSKFICSHHHFLLAEVLEKVYRLEIRRLIINIPPGYTKTELVGIQFLSWTLSLRPDCRFLYITGGDDLAKATNLKLKDQITNEAYQALYPVQIRNDQNTKNRWHTTAGGAVHATAINSQVTGFRAGSFKEGFRGAIIMDDILKPNDAHSVVKRTAINDRITDTVKSRLNDRDTPIILIMQRLHEEDPTGFLLNGGTGETWHHLNLPALIEL